MESLQEATDWFAQNLLWLAVIGGVLVLAYAYSAPIVDSAIRRTLAQSLQTTLGDSRAPPVYGSSSGRISSSTSAVSGSRKTVARKPVSVPKTPTPTTMMSVPMTRPTWETG